MSAPVVEYPQPRAEITIPKAKVLPIGKRVIEWPRPEGHPPPSAQAYPFTLAPRPTGD